MDLIVEEISFCSKRMRARLLLNPLEKPLKSPSRSRAEARASTTEILRILRFRAPISRRRRGEIKITSDVTAGRALFYCP